jgi:hypothetical protein
MGWAPEKTPLAATPQQKKPLPRCGLYSKEKNRRRLSLPTALILLAEQG